jgi:hypothetical protein
MMETMMKGFQGRFWMRLWRKWVHLRSSPFSLDFHPKSDTRYGDWLAVNAALLKSTRARR